MDILKVVFFIVFNVTAVLSSREDGELLGNHKIRMRTCNSDVCRERAKLILASVNQTADPCEDFYEYVCNRWIDAHPIKENSGSYDGFSMVKDGVARDLKGLLEEIANTTHARSLTEKMGMAYRACKNSLTLHDKEKGVKIIREILAKSGLDLWPFMGNATARRPFENSVEVLNVTGGLSSIFSISLVKDPSDGKSKILQIEQLTALLTEDDTRKPQPEKSNNTRNEDIDHVKSFVAMFRPNATDAELTSFARGEFEIRAALAELVQPLSERRNVSGKFAKRTIEEAEADLAGFPLLELLNKKFRESNVTLQASDKIVINFMDYLNNTLQFIRNTDPIVLYNYIGGKTALELAEYTWVPLGRPLDANGNNSQNVKDHDITRACLVILHELIPELLGRLYLEHKFPDKTRAEAREILLNVGKTYYKTLRTVPWMDIITRRRAIHKLWKMVPYVGHSGFNLSEDALSKYFDQVGPITSNDSFVEIVVKFDKNSASKMYASLRDNAPLWLPRGGPEVNAFNLFAFNEIVISAGILRGTFFEPGLPSFINLGAIGAVIGHEISHAYDDRGSQFDAIGRLVNWWTNYTQQEYERKRDCFVKQYGSIVDPVANMSLNGIITLGENIADNAGVRAAYYTHQSVVPDFDDVTLPGLENFTRDQLFFISYALMGCANSRRWHIVEQIREHVHTPSKYRVNVPLKNLEQFSAAFNCKLGSGMRLPRSERCILW